MSGLLERLGGALGSPAAGGLLASAAVGIHPALGLLALPGLMAAQKQGQSEREQAQSRAALELELLTEEVQSRRRTREAVAALPGLLGAPTIPDDLVGPPRPGVMRATDQRQGLLANLTQIAPAQVATGLLGQVFPQEPRPSRIEGQVGAIQQYLGRNPTEAELLRLLGVTDGAPSPQDALAAFRLAQEQEEAERLASERSRAQAARDAQTEAVAEEAVAVIDQLDALEEAGSLLRPGSSSAVADTLRSAQGFIATALDVAGASAEADRFRTDNENADTLGKSLNALRNTYVDLVVGEGATNQERRAAEQAFPTLDMEEGAILSGLKLTLRQALRRARINGASEESIASVQSVLDRLEGEEPPAPTRPVTVEFDE